jgi:HK97 family phage portal protein
MAIETLADLVLTRGGYDMSAPERRSNTLADPDPWLLEAFGVQRTASGESVTPQSALTFAAVQAAHRFLSEVEASLPCHLYRRRFDASGNETPGKDKARDYYLYSMLHDAPNEEQTGFDFWQAMRQNRAAWGNAYALPLYSGTGRWTGIYPLRPDWMSVTRNAAGQKIYQYRPGWGPFERNYLASEIIHVRGMGDDLVGWSPIRLMREGIGLGMAAARSSASFYRNGARMSGVLSMPGKVRPGFDGKPSPEEQSFQDKYTGAHNTGKVLVIGDGSKFTSTTIPPDDAQFLETVKDAGRFVWMVYGIPPHLMGDTEKSTSWGTGIEQQVIGLQKFTLRPSLEMTQQAFERVLLGVRERGMFIEFDIDGLLAGDAKTREEVLALRRQNGIIKTDEWRSLVNLNPLGGEEGEALLVNSTMVPIKTALQGPVAPTAPPQQ